MLTGQKVHMSFKPVTFIQNVHVTKKKNQAINLDRLKNQNSSSVPNTHKSFLVFLIPQIAKDV
jgi:hypothetical protein